MTRKEVTQYLNDNKEELIRLRKSGLQIQEIADRFGLNRQTVNGFLARNGVVFRHNLSDSEKEEIVNRYLSGETPKSICKDYHITSSKVSEIVKSYGYTTRDLSHARRIYHINDSYFDVIDNQNKAYILGLLIADGSVSKNSYAISLGLQESDVDLLVDINKELENERPLRFIELSKKYPNYSNQYTLGFNSPHIKDTLEKYGIHPCKDFSTYFPENIDHDLYRHVIRGIFDGDGCISKTEARCNITGNIQLISFIKQHIEDELNIHVTMYIPHKKDKQNTSTRTMQIAGAKQSSIFLDYIYKDSNLHIKRKYDLYCQKYCKD